MRAIAAFVVVAGAMQSAQVPPRDLPGPPVVGTGVISGRVVVADSKPVVPVRRARVTLSGGRLRVDEVTDTDIEGNYLFGDLMPATYRLSVSKPGFVTLQAGATRAGENPPGITLPAGERRDIDVALPRGAAIDGQLLSESGEPLQHVIVSAVRFRQTAQGPRVLLVREGRTDDRGRYRIHSLPEGEYYVEATPDPRLTDEGAGAVGERPPGIGRTYFPGTTHVHEARRVQLSRGQEVTGVDFAVTAVPLARVGGVVIDSSGKLSSAFGVRLRPVAGPSLSLGISVVYAEGRFQAMSVPPGSYWLVASVLPARDAVSEFAAMRVTVDGQDQTDLTVTPAPGTVLDGRIESDGDALPPLAGVRLAMVAHEFDLPPSRPVAPAPAVAADGTFRIKGLFGRQSVRLANLPAGWALKTVLLDGEDITDVPMDFRGSNVPRSLRLILTNKTARLGGSVASAGGAAAAFQVVVLPEDERHWGEASRFVRTDGAREGGGFEITGLLPGNYRVVAVASIDEGAWHDPEVLGKLRAAGVRVTLTEGSSETLTLPLQVLR